MKRPFAIFGSAYFAGLLAAVFFAPESLLILLVATLLFFAISMAFEVLRKNGYIPSAALCFETAIFVFMICSSQVSSNCAPFADKTLNITAEITDTEESGDSFVYTLQKFRSDDGSALPEDYSVLLYSNTVLCCEPGYTINAKLDIRDFRDDFGLSSRKSHLSKGEYLAAVINSDSDTELIPASAGKEILGTTVRNFFASIPAKYLNPENAGISSAMLLGISPDTEIYDEFRNAGVSHLLVVSGLHMAILAGLVLAFLKKLRLHRIASAIITIIFVLIYMAITGFGHSSVRAGAMYIILLLAPIFGRESDSLNTLGLAVLVICLFSPYAAGDTGFLLSASATLGIILLSGRMSRAVLSHFNEDHRLFGALKYITELFTVSIAANLFVSPVLILVFGYIQPESIIFSMLLSLPAAVIIFCSLIICLLGAIPFISGIVYPFAFMDGILCKLSLSLCSAVPNTGASPLGSIGLIILMGVILILILVLSFRARKKLTIAITSAVLLIYASGFAASYAYSFSVTRLISANCGNGYFTAVVHHGKAVILTAGGNDTELPTELLAESRIGKIEGAFLSTGSYGELEAVLTAEEQFGAFPVTVQEDLLPLGNDFVAEDIYKTKYSRDIFGDGAVLAFCEDSGRRIRLIIYGKEIIIDRKGVYYSPESCAVYITEKARPEISSSFTILESDDIINENTAFPTGNYLLQPEGEALFADLNDNGEIKLRRSFR